MKPTPFSSLALFCLACVAACDAGKTSASTSSTSTSSTGGSSSATASSGKTATSSTAASSSSGSAGTGGAGGQGTTGAGGGSGGGASLPGWTLVWSDEFNGPDGSAVDTSKWVYGGPEDGQYNKELEYYNPSTDNVFVAGGNLHLVAKVVPQDGGPTCSYGACQYTSGKIMTKASGSPSLFEKQYGRFSARMKIPAGQGMWPAFWMLGNNIDSVSWPTCGEIDIMENVGNTPATDYGTLHGPNGSQEANLGGTTMLSTGALSDDFHVYSVEWKADEVDFFLDDTVYFTGTTAQFPGTFVFDDHPFYLILNLAIGGNWPGSPDASTVFPAELLVDWVRVYDPAP